MDAFAPERVAPPSTPPKRSDARGSFSRARARELARIAVVAVAINSVARGPTAAAPSSRSELGVGDPFDEAGRLAGGEALAEAEKRNLPVLTGRSAARASDSLKRRLRLRAR